MDKQDVEKLRNVGDILSSDDKQNMFEPEAQDIWLSDLGLLTPEYLNKIINRILYLLDDGIKNVSVEYSAVDKTIKLDIFLSRWSYLFRKDKILNKLNTFSNISLSRYHVMVKFLSYKRNKAISYA